MRNAEAHKRAANKYDKKFYRPTVLIPKDNKDLYTDFVKNKGYNSLSEYVNSILKYDLNSNFVPDKKTLLELISKTDVNQ